METLRFLAMALVADAAADVTYSERWRKKNYKNRR
jgi:hypothetical protein